MIIHNSILEIITFLVPSFSDLTIDVQNVIIVVINIIAMFFLLVLLVKFFVKSIFKKRSKNKW